MFYCDLGYYLCFIVLCCVYGIVVNFVGVKFLWISFKFLMHDNL